MRRLIGGFSAGRCEDPREQERRLRKLRKLKPGQVLRNSRKYRKLVSRLAKISPEMKKLCKIVTPAFLNKRTSEGSQNLTKGGD